MKQDLPEVEGEYLYDYSCAPRDLHCRMAMYYT
jgi:hypothetical protein